MGNHRSKIKIGDRFGRLVVVSENGRDNFKNIIWMCKCDCGNHHAVVATVLLRGTSNSCGCIRKERFHKLITKHGLRYTKIYRVWAEMIQRCKNSKASGYKNYGGRGIEVCESWKNFINFYNDMNESYREGLEIERINNNGNYEHTNCRWATRQEQSLNKKSNHIIRYNGKRMTLKEWSNVLNINYDMLRSRINTYGWSIKDAFTLPTYIKRL